jgi:hypothetical protein
LLFMKVLRIFGALSDAVTAYSLMERVMTFPNGQVKNFLVACRTVKGSGPMIRICVKGSRGQQGGGLWHKYFALYCSFFYDSVVVDFFDPNEIPMEWTLANPQISCQWFAIPYLKDGSEYDCIIDDAWVPEQGPMPFVPKSQYWSLKGRDDSSAPFIPYLHTGETRSFSHPAYTDYVGPCHCMVCRAIDECVHSYSQYLFMRLICLRLGHITSCGDTPGSQDIVRIGDVLRQLESTTQVEIVSSAVSRSIMSLSEELGLRFKGSRVVALDRQASPAFIPLVHVEGAVGQVSRKEDSSVVPWLVGRRVAFAGVDPSILMSTKISRQSPPEVLFVKDLLSWEMSSGVPVVYCPTDPKSVMKFFPCYQASGRLLHGFHEYNLDVEIVSPQSMSGLYSTGGRRSDVTVRPGESSSVPLKPYYYRVETRTLHPPIMLAPYIVDHFPLSFKSLHLLPTKVERKGCSLLSVVRKGSVVELHPTRPVVDAVYSDLLWRHPSGEWGFITVPLLSALTSDTSWIVASKRVPPGSPPTFVEAVDLRSSHLFGETENIQKRVRFWYTSLSHRDHRNVISLAEFLGWSSDRVRLYLELQLEFVLSGEDILKVSGSYAG